MTTAYHAKYYAYDLTKIGPASQTDRLSMSLFDACVDLNPHQIEAALFAVRSPVSKGVVLADEVGLGKTIEAGIVLCQSWAEDKRKLLIICPASLRKQWALELQEKFGLPTTILDAKTYGQCRKDGIKYPFDQSAIIITSYNFAAKFKEEIKAVKWHLCIIDEAHKLRNCYRASNKIGQAIKLATEDVKKILLTATPLQNSLMELYGLSSLIDDRIFGDPASFRGQYTNSKSDLADLRDRITPFCKRTLRQQVLEYVPYTERKLITRGFKPNDDEHKLYESVSEFLLRDETYAIPHRQKHLTTLIIRKLLASSSHAIAATLDTIATRLQSLKQGIVDDSITEKLVEEEDLEEEYYEELPEMDFPSFQEEGAEFEHAPLRVDSLDLAKLEQEITEVEQYARWARSIGVDTKSRTLLSALEIGFKEMDRMGAAKKALVFTESRRTQDYLKNFLEANGYAGKIVLFNGTNSDPESKVILNNWLEANTNTGRATGSKPIDMRTALVENFRDTAQIMIATEAAAEGVNLQFCSMLVNYDLPWNPQRIEQRIGRVHRYGQKFDVVVINLLNERNEADQRVHQLLEEKFNLFSGLFGASDEVLGTIESGVDFEKRVHAIYQQCRSQAEIDTAFKKLQEELDDQIRNKIDDTKKLLLEHFDEDVHARLRMQLDDTKTTLDAITRKFWAITKYKLLVKAKFNDDDYSFDMIFPADEKFPFTKGQYRLISKDKENVPGEFLYRLGHPLGQWVIEQCKQDKLGRATLKFRYSEHPTKISVVEAMKGKWGWMTLQLLTLQSFEKEEYLLFTGVLDDGTILSQETCEKLFQVDSYAQGCDNIPLEAANLLGREAEQYTNATIHKALERNSKLFQEEQERLEKWAEDLIFSAEKELEDAKNQIKAMKRAARQAVTTEEQHRIQSDLKEMERRQRRLRQKIFDYTDEIEAKRDDFIDRLEKRLRQDTKNETLFTVRFTVE